MKVTKILTTLTKLPALPTTLSKRNRAALGAALILAAFAGCEAMAEFFHGEAPETHKTPETPEPPRLKNHLHHHLRRKRRRRRSPCLRNRNRRNHPHRQKRRRPNPRRLHLHLLEHRLLRKKNGYSFTYEGCEGYDGYGNNTDGAAPTTEKTQPVSRVSWRDAIVWCNAYSTMSGKTPAYYDNSGKTVVTKSLTGDTVFMKINASGYRLPTEAEWEAAARGGNPSADDWSYTYAGSNMIDDVAWYSDNAG